MLKFTGFDGHNSAFCTEYFHRAITKNLAYRTVQCVLKKNKETGQVEEKGGSFRPKNYLQQMNNI